MLATTEPRLTGPQEQFARQNRATPGQQSPVLNAVYLYRAGRGQTTRWLVSEFGHVLETVTFVELHG